MSKPKCIVSGKELEIGDIVIVSDYDKGLYVKRVIGWGAGLDDDDPIYDYDEYAQGFSDNTVFIINGLVNDNIKSGVG